ncbi:hypothetical protein DFH06DRAFT_1295044 [Mycena polygramma]|nr:hypothetical protein DFH06DRAFT_1295044 [Mycena polygramma]
MFGVENLRARVAELATAMHLQRNSELLKAPGREKCLAQRELNAALDPLARLPLELSSEIFLQSLPSFPERKPSRYCAVYSGPVEWNQITFPCDPGFTEGVQAWLDRAANRPLSVSLCGPGSFDPGATDFVWRHGQQLEHLDLCYQEEEADEYDFIEDVDLLGGNPGTLPLLRTLVIRGLTTLRLEDDQGYYGPQILDLLRLAPNLVECTIEFPSNEWGFLGRPESLVIPALRQFSLGDSEATDEGILYFLTLPGLETISMLTRKAYAHGLLSLLERSLPPLRELALGDVNFIRLGQCLRLVPTVETFLMWWPRSELLINLLDALAESPSLLPRLDTLAIHVLSSNFGFSASWTALARALSSRRAQLGRVHVEVTQDRYNPHIPVDRPMDDVILVFRDLAAGGMQIYIGSRGGNHTLFDSDTQMLSIPSATHSEC